MTEPEPPVNVRVVLTDKTLLPVDSVYAGVDEEGLHRWEVLIPDGVCLRVLGLRCDLLPARTSLSVRVILGE